MARSSSSSALSSGAASSSSGSAVQEYESDDETSRAGEGREVVSLLDGLISLVSLARPSREEPSEEPCVSETNRKRYSPPTSPDLGKSRQTTNKFFSILKSTFGDQQATTR